MWHFGEHLNCVKLTVPVSLESQNANNTKKIIFSLDEDEFAYLYIIPFSTSMVDSHVHMNTRTRQLLHAAFYTVLWRQRWSPGSYFHLGDVLPARWPSCRPLVRLTKPCIHTSQQKPGRISVVTWLNAGGGKTDSFLVHQLMWNLCLAT